jgi:hypothetical protein
MAYRQTYNVKTPVGISATGVGIGLAITLMAFNLALFIWFVYLLVKIAGHVGAWPF